ELKKQKQRKSEIDASVEALQKQIPASPELDQVFDIIATSAQAAGVTLTSATRGELAAFAPRSAPVPAGPDAAAQQKAAQVAPQPTPQPTASGPVGDAKNVATQADVNAAKTSQAGSGTTAQGGTSASAPAAGSVAATRQQIPVAVIASVPDAAAAQAFLDGLRSSSRLLAVNKATLTPGSIGLEIHVDLLAFLTDAPGASK
ncbi:MAG: hypothetical protein B7X41_14075, partial [Microbacterium sp. 14-71-5]